MCSSSKMWFVSSHNRSSGGSSGRGSLRSLRASMWQMLSGKMSQLQSYSLKMYNGLFINYVITYWGIQTPHPSPLSSCHLSATTSLPTFVSVNGEKNCRVADDYLFTSAALSLFRFDMTHELYSTLGACLKF